MSILSSLVWHDPLWLLLLPLLPLLFWVRQKAKRPRPALIWTLAVHVPTWRTRLWRLLPWLRAAALALLLIAMARPQRLLQEKTVKTEGIDIGLVLDVSESMLAEDFRPNRLEASKRVAIDFVKRRSNDRISLTLFAGEAFSPCPLTTDHRILEELIAGIRHGIIRDNTAIGDGLATAVNRLKDAPSRSKVIILLTDGENNAGYIQPAVAAEIAQAFGIKVYTIGMGAAAQFSAWPGAGEAPVDEALLSRMAEITGGKYFRAEDPQALARIYAEIDRLEKTETETAVVRLTSEAFFPFIWAALWLLFVELLLRFTLLRSIP